MASYDREYCCSKCGLIYFGTWEKGKYEDCPECGNIQNLDNAIYACDTMGWAYASERVVDKLKKQGKKIHYHEEHPWYDKEE